MLNGYHRHLTHPEYLSSSYTLTKIHKPTPVGRPIVAGNDGPTERILSFVDSLLQPIAKSQKSYLKDELTLLTSEKGETSQRTLS